MRYLISALCAFVLLASLPSLASAAPVVYCGIVKANTVTSGAGSGARVFEFRTSTGPGGPDQRFSVPDSIALPTVGSYICGQFEQGAPSLTLVSYVRQGDPGYVADPAVATTTAPAATATSTGTAASSLPSTSSQSQSTSTDFTLTWLLLALAILAVIAGLIARGRRATSNR